MRTLESYHIVGFILMYISLHKQYSFKSSELKIHANIYLLASIAPFIVLAASSDSNSIEQLMLVLSYMSTIQALSSIFNFQNEQVIKVKLENYAHTMFVISMLMLMYNKKIAVQIGYLIMIAFSILSLLANKTTINFGIQDYIILHLLFFFTK